MSSYLSFYELLHELIVQRSAVVNRNKEKDKAASCANKHDCRLGEHIGGVDYCQLDDKIRNSTTRKDLQVSPIYF